VPYAPRRSTPAGLAAFALALALPAGPARALHRDSPNAARITRGAAHLHPGTRSWNKYLAFSSTEDLTSSGATGRHIYLFNLHDYDCFAGTITETPCPSPPRPYLVQVTSGAGNPDNPTVDETGTLVAFDADGTFNGGTGPASARRQVFIADLSTDPITYTNVTGEVAGADGGDSVRPSFNSVGAVMVFESTAPLGGGPVGVSQIFTYQRLSGILTRITSAEGPSQAPMLTKDGTRFAFESTAALDGAGNGPDTGVWQIYFYDRSTRVTGPRLKPVTQGNGPSRHPYVAEKNQMVFFDSAATDLPGTTGGPGTQIYAADLDVYPPTFAKVTWGPGDATWPAVPPTVDRVAFIATGDLLANGTTGDRLFVRRFDKTPNGLTLQGLYQITGRGNVQGPLGASLGQWFVSLSTTDDMTGTGLCARQLHVVDYFDNPVHWPAATAPGQVPLEPPPGNADLGCVDGNACTIDTCTAGTCEHTVKPDGAACDATVCSFAGTCQQGACSGGPRCGDTNACTVDSCSPFAGCIYDPIPGCVPCSTASQCPDDGDPCTRNECTAGVCVYTPKQDGESCSTPCRTGDVCTGGVCGGGGPKDCSDSDPCTLDVCDAGSGQCLSALQSDCRPCASISQCQDGNPCTTKSCVGGFCQITQKQPGDLCADSNPCDGTEVCNDQGLCGVSGTLPPAPCSPPDACHTGTCDPSQPGNCRFDPIPGCITCSPNEPGLCIDGNPCTKDLCIGGKCQNPPENDGTPCSDGDACNGLEHCQSGFCQGGTAPDCDDQILCTDDSCEPAVGCEHTPRPAFCDDANVCTTDSCSLALGCLHLANSSPCDDANRCTENDLCIGTVCAGVPVSVDDRNSCTDDSCTPLGGVVHVTRPDGAVCTDGDRCTANDQCIAGTCVGAPVTLDDGNPCTDDSCSPTVGVVHTPKPDGLRCNDGDPCTANDACVAGTCAGAPIEVDDGNPCTDDFCTPAGGIVHANKPDGAACNDGNRCTGNDQCSSGACVGTPVPVDDGNFCTDDACSQLLGVIHTPKADGLRCNDADPCTENEACIAGVCAGAPVAVDDGNPCTDDSCSPMGIIVHTPRPDGLACNDGNRCTATDECVSGTCVGTPVPVDDGNFCTDDACSPTLGVLHLPKPDGVRCNDGDLCTESDACVAGTCAGRPIVADDGNPCTDDACSPTLGPIHLARPDGTRCGLGDGCTLFPTCHSGHCTGDPGSGSCTDHDPCTADACDPVAGCQHAETTGFEGVFCRLAQLEELMADPPLRPGLSTLVARAGRRTARAQPARPETALYHLRIAERLLRVFIARLIRGDGDVPRDHAVETAHKARQVLDPLTILRRRYGALVAAAGSSPAPRAAPQQ
jgi:Tol biopolymer transport system component